MGSKRLLIARHGNTFEAGETSRRIGARTDLPLTSKGREQAKRIAFWLTKEGLEPDVILTGSLQRTKCTAEIIAAHLTRGNAPIEATWLNEVDYGPDEGKPEVDILKRVGETALNAWDQRGIPAPGWPIDRDKMIDDCQRNVCLLNADTTLLVTSNGLGRFLLIALGVDANLSSLKMRTGGLTVLDMSGGRTSLLHWNVYS